MRRGEVFGRIGNTEFHANRFGSIVREEWLRVSFLREEIELDEWILMPDHLHAIVGITFSSNVKENPPPQLALRAVASLVVRFKSAATSRINTLRGTSTRVWQRNYWEHIIRDERDLNNTRHYIPQNPARWTTP